MNRLTIIHDNCEDVQTDLVIDGFHGMQIGSTEIGQTGIEYTVIALTQDGKITVGHHSSDDAAREQVDRIWELYNEVVENMEQISSTQDIRIVEDQTQDELCRKIQQIVKRGMTRPPKGQALPLR